MQQRNPSAPVRDEMTIDGRRLSYLDFGGTGRPLLALHGHLDEAETWSDLAGELAPRWRVIAPDQRGHGDSDRAGDQSREGYLADAVALLDHLGLDEVAVIGHSGMGRTAYQLAGRHPDRVSALISEEGGAVIGVEGGPGALGFVLGWPYTATTRQDLLDALGPVAAPMFADRLRPLPDGSWRLPFHPEDTVTSERLVLGDHWDEWLGSECPALLVAGTRRPCLDAGLTAAMVARRPGTRLAEFDTDHFVHQNAPGAFAGTVREFLTSVAR